MGVIVLASGILLVSSQQLSVASRTTAGSGYQQLAMAAAEAVAARQETTIATYANGGDPASWVDLTDPKIAGNYGETWLGSCRVRWKVEPAATATVAPDGTEGWNYIVNPAPDTTTPTSKPRIGNDGTYLFRIAAEALYMDGTTSSAKTLARAQAVRFAAVDKIPLFRYVIFYAKNGPKGDLEFSHGPGMKIRGNVHSNGSIYLGGGTQVNDYTALLRSAGGTVAVTTDPMYGEDASATIIGPDQNGKNVRVCGVDGVFRLSKQVLFGAFNAFPMVGSSPAGTPVTSWYSTATAPAPGEGGPQPNYRTPNVAGISLADITYNGQIINPNRIKDVSGLMTRDLSSTDVLRKINGIAIRGFTSGSFLSPDTAPSSATKANDSRDVTRTNYVWKTDSLKNGAPGFSGYLRSDDNGGKQVPLAKTMLLRPLEAQAISMPTYKPTGVRATQSDGVTPDSSFPYDNPTTADVDEEENHWDALPMFVTPAGIDTAVMPITGNVVEKPGSLLRSALGRDDTYFVRRTAMTGWNIAKVDGSTAPGTDLQPVGLMIRERPVPDPLFTATLKYPSSLSADYMPYAYGKPRPGEMPFWPIDVADSMSAYDFLAGTAGPYDSGTRNVSALVQKQTYSTGGAFTVSAANRAGPPPSLPNNYPRRPAYYRGNWRMFNLKKPLVDDSNPDTSYFKSSTSTNGLRATYFFGQSFSGKAHVQIDPNINFNWGNGSPTLTSGPGGYPSDSFSVRWEGKITAPKSGSFLFGTFTDDVCRIWVDGVLVLHQTSYSGSTVWGLPIQLEQGKSYSFVTEMVEGGGGAACQVYWSYPTNAGGSIIPSSSFNPPDIPVTSSATTFRKEPFFRLMDFSAVQMRIEGFTNASAPNAKIALMIQDAVAGTTYTQGGRAPYAAIAYSPTRGFFLEYRGAPSDEQTITATLHYIGNGTENALPAPLAQVFSPTGAATVRAAKLTSAADNPGALATQSGQQIVDSQWVSTDYTVIGSPWNTSEGTVDKVRLGPVAYSWTKTPQAYNRSSIARTSTFNVTNLDPSGAFNASDYSKAIQLYTAATGSAQPSPSTIPADGWSYDAGTNKITYTSTNYTGTNGNYWSPWVTWGTPTSNTTAYGTSKTIYPPYPKYYNGGTYVRDATAAETLAYMNSNYGGGFVIAASGDMPVYVAPATPTYSAGIPPNTSAGLPPSLATGTFYFSVPRTVQPTIDLNSYVSRWGPWYSSGQLQWLPTMSGYSSWSLVGVTSAVMPKAFSFAPDAWYSANWSPLLPPVPPGDGAAPISLVNSPRWLDDLPTGPVPVISPTSQIWLRIEKVPVPTVITSTTVRFLYYVGASAPASASAFTVIKNGAVDLTCDLAGFGQSVTYAAAGLKPCTQAYDRQIFIGPAVQSGTVSFPAEASLSSMQVETNFSVASGLSKWDATKWENGGATGPNDMTRYLASQYQVFFGSQEITEDFFSYNQTLVDNRLATEDWIYNPREFWSQSKWWDGNQGRLYFKESTSQGAAEANYQPGGGISNRELFSKMTLLTLDLRQVQDYLKTRTLDQAVTKTISLGAIPPAVGLLPTLASKFNKLIYAARTNRYPVNPRSGSPNPWNPYLPNTTDDMANLATATQTDVKAMQPYGLPYAPAMRSQQFIHGVRIRNGDTIDWERSGAVIPNFGNSKLSIVTPNQLVVQGNLNYNSLTPGVWPTVLYKGANDSTHPTPVALMGDALTFLSANFKDEPYKVPGLVTAADGSSVISGGTLAYGSALPLPTASDTFYYCSIVTNNQPTTKVSVMNGEAASIINVMEHLENWNGVRMTYSGSLVVLDTRRYANHYLLDAGKNYGWGPFGFHLTSGASSTWLGTWGLSALFPIYNRATMALPTVQGAPQRSLTFNYDLLTEAGTPPFAPFGVSVSGRGGWTKIIQ